MEEGRKKAKARVPPKAVAVGARGDNKYKFFMGEKKETDELKMRRPRPSRGALPLLGWSDSEEAEDDDDDKNGARRWLEL